MSPAGQEANPALVYLTRGELTESASRGAFAVANKEGEIVAELGDIGRMVFPRSAIKLIQALPLVESGAARAFGLSARELALACASHSGEPEHVAAVSAWLARIGAEEDALICGPHLPYDVASAEALIRAGTAPSRLHNNCSGKHTGFLTLCRHLKVPLSGYDRLDHPVERGIIEALSDLSGVSPLAMGCGIDGCGAPNFAIPLRNLAIAMARIADPSALAANRRDAIEQLRAAATHEPFFTAGTGRLCTRIMSEAKGVYVKTGAEGVYVAALPELGLGVALKIDDGAKPSAEALITALLVGLGALEPTSPIIADTMAAPVKNTLGQIAAVREVALDLLIETLDDFSPQALAAAGAVLPRIEPVKGRTR